jgi:hypothetical protein
MNQQHETSRPNPYANKRQRGPCKEVLRGAFVTCNQAGLETLEPRAAGWDCGDNGGGSIRTSTKRAGLRHMYGFGTY